MRAFKKQFEELGYTFQSPDVLEDVYLFYKYYDNKINKGLSAILLEGEPECGKTYLSEIFNAFLGEDTVNLYTQCVEETNSDRLISTYNVPVIVKGDDDKSIIESILTKAIKLANKGKTVVLTIDELDKSRKSLDSYLLDFIQDARIETSNNEMLRLTEVGRKNLYVILAKNDERELSDALLERCSVIKLPPMPPVLAYKTLVRNFKNIDYDPKFLEFICKVYENLYNEQMNSNEELLTRLPSLQEITTAISNDYELYKNGISSTRRIKCLIRKLGKDDETRNIITDILTKKFEYQNQESNYTNETFDLDVGNPNDYMSIKDPDSLVEQYIISKENDEYSFDKNEFDDPLKDIANILENMKYDESLVFIDKENKEKIVELGVLTHKDPKALQILFDKVRFKGNPNSRFGFLNFEGDDFVGLMQYKNTLILIANKEYVSPRLLMRGLSTIITIIYDSKENLDLGNLYFSEFSASNFKLTGLNAKILSNIPNFVLNKMDVRNGVHTYQTSNLKVTYDDDLNVSYFRYMQKYKAEPLYEVIEKICRFNPELAIPVSFINAKKFNTSSDRNLVLSYSKFKSYLEDYEDLKLNGWEIIVDDFDTMDLTFVTREAYRYDYRNTKYEHNKERDTFVFEPKEEYDEKNKKIYIYPKYKLKNGYLVYTSDKDFENDDLFKQLSPFQKEIAIMMRSIFGNFVPLFYRERNSDYFSSLTMSHTGRIVEDEKNRKGIPGIQQDITTEEDVINYYDSLSQPSNVITPIKVLKKDKTLK